MAQELIEPAQEVCVEPKELARYEGEGGREAPEPAAAHTEEPNMMNRHAPLVGPNAKCKVSGTDTLQIA